jgi:NADH-quinone oxidoreductase subunit M
MQMVCHGISTGALFILAGALQDRLHTRDLRKMGGFWKALPHFGAMGMLFGMASLGLPGLGNFVGEFLILLGTFQAYPILAAIAALGLVAAPIYALYMIQEVFFGSMEYVETTNRDLQFKEWIIFASLAIVIVWLGLYPHSVLNTTQPVIQQLLDHTQSIETISSSLWTGIQ